MKIPKNVCWKATEGGACANCELSYDACTYRWKKANRSPEEHARKVREQNLQRNYGLSLERFQEMLVEQGGVCAICRTDEPGGRHGVFHVDHCHSSGKIRGLTCDACNRMLGFARDNDRTLNRAGEYLRLHR